MPQVLWFHCPLCENIKELERFDGKLAKWEKMSQDTIENLDIILQEFGGRGESRWEIDERTGEFVKHAQGKMEWTNITGQQSGRLEKLREQIRARCVRILSELDAAE